MGLVLGRKLKAGVLRFENKKIKITTGTQKHRENKVI
jgi:hypothetical protein